MIEGLDSVFTEHGLKLIIRKNSDIRLEALRAESLETSAIDYARRQSGTRRQGSMKASKTAARKKTAGSMPRKNAEHASISLGWRSTSDETSLYEAIKREFIDLVCSSSKKYAELRVKFREGGKALSRSTLVALIATKLGAVVAVSAGVVTTIVSLLLLSALRLGLEAFCATRRKG
jgi:hypothetical protein